MGITWRLLLVENEPILGAREGQTPSKQRRSPDCDGSIACASRTGSSAASFAAAKALLVKGKPLDCADKDGNAFARETARASHDLRASLNLERSLPQPIHGTMDQVSLLVAVEFGPGIEIAGTAAAACCVAKG